MTAQLTPADGTLWGTAHDIIANISAAARITVARLRDWARRGLVRSVRIGRSCWYALTDVLAAERDTRQTAAKRGGTRRGQRKQAA